MARRSQRSLMNEHRIQQVRGWSLRIKCPLTKLHVLWVFTFLQNFLVRISVVVVLETLQLQHQHRRKLGDFKPLIEFYLPLRAYCKP